MEYIVLILLIGIFSSGMFFFLKKEHPENQNISISNSSAPPNLDICDTEGIVESGSVHSDIRLAVVTSTH